MWGDVGFMDYDITSLIAERVTKLFHKVMHKHLDYRYTPPACSPGPGMYGPIPKRTTKSAWQFLALLFPDPHSHASLPQQNT